MTRPRLLVLLLSLLGLVAALLALPPGAAVAQDEPTTEFEDNGGSEWTSFEGEQSFLAAVAEGSERVELTQIGETLEGRPIQLVNIGHPAPATREEALERPTMYFTCSVHGNEPAGRESCMIQLRNLAFTDDPELMDLLSTTTVLFTPSANPDGREADSRGNSTGADVNRDHMNLRQIESQAIGSVIRDWEPEVTLDLHEYGPGQPVVYDDDILVLWSRNVNVDEQVYDLGVELSKDYLIAGSEEEGYSADEYGLASVGEQDLTQTAGGPDEGILRNVGGLRHSIGILVESAVSPRLINPIDPLDAQNDAMPRRVQSQVVVIDQALDFITERGDVAMETTAASRVRKADEGADRSAPMYFGGQRQDSTIDGSGPPPSEGDTIDPPVCGYRLTQAQFEHVSPTMDLLDIFSFDVDGAVEVPMGQVAEPIIHLLLDERGDRNHFTGRDSTWEGEDVPEALDQCSTPPAATPDGQPPTGPPADAPTDPPSGGEPGQDARSRLIRRISGQSRPDTAAAAAEIGVVEADTVVIATTLDYADALGGAVLARSLGAPLLLSEPEALSGPVADEITRRGVDQAILLGGVAALSEQVASDLEDLGVTVQRLDGANRFETAALIHDELGGGDDIVVVEGEHASAARGWPDAVSGSVLDKPILLVNANRLPEETAERLDGATVTIVGGPVAVSDQVKDDITDLADSVERVFGQTRYGTSRAAFESRSFTTDGNESMWLASGRDWPEALVGAANASLFFLLIDGLDPDGSPETTDYLVFNQRIFDTVNLVGDQSQITPEVEASLREKLNG